MAHSSRETTGSMRALGVGPLICGGYGVGRRSCDLLIFARADLLSRIEVEQKGSGSSKRARAKRRSRRH